MTVHLSDGRKLSTVVSGVQGKRADLEWENAADVFQRDKEVERRATALRQGIERCCDARGDDDENRAALIRECGELSPDAQADMLDHFQREANRFGPKRGDFG